jgi:hypothetical protein
MSKRRTRIAVTTVRIRSRKKMARVVPAAETLLDDGSEYLNIGHRVSRPRAAANHLCVVFRDCQQIVALTSGLSFTGYGKGQDLHSMSSQNRGQCFTMTGIASGHDECTPAMLHHHWPT